MRQFVVLAVILTTPAPVFAEIGVPCRQPARPGRQAEQANTALVQRFHAAINHQRWGAAEAMLASEYRHFVPAASGFRSIDWPAFKRGNQHLRTAFPDWSNAVVQTIAQGDKVAVILQGSGTHRGSVAGEKATLRRATLPIMIVHQICRGKLIADWEMVDTEPMMGELKQP